MGYPNHTEHEVNGKRKKKQEGTRDRDRSTVVISEFAPHLHSLSPLVQWLQVHQPKGQGVGHLDQLLLGNPGSPRGSGPASAVLGTSLWRRPRCTGHLGMIKTMNQYIKHVLFITEKNCVCISTCQLLLLRCYHCLYLLHTL